MVLEKIKTLQLLFLEIAKAGLLKLNMHTIHLEILLKCKPDSNPLDLRYDPRVSISNKQVRTRLRVPRPSFTMTVQTTELIMSRLSDTNFNFPLPRNLV